MDMKTLDEKIREKARKEYRDAITRDAQKFVKDHGTGPNGQVVQTRLYAKDEHGKHCVRPDYINEAMDGIVDSIVAANINHVQQRAVDAFLADVANLKDQVEALQQGVTSE